MICRLLKESLSYVGDSLYMTGFFCQLIYGFSLFLNGG